jgi:hypothetical protein
MSRRIIKPTRSRRNNQGNQLSTAIADLQVRLTVGEGEAGIVEYPHPERIPTINHIANRALLALESPRGRDVLAELGVRIVTETRPSTLYPINDPDFAQMPHYVGVFLEKLRMAFPRVILEVLLGPEAEFARRNWRTANSTLDTFVARDSGVLRVDYDVGFQIGYQHCYALV